MNLKCKEFIEHCSGLWVSSDGEVYMDIKCDKYPNGHFTYGCTDNRHGYKRVRYKGKDYYVHKLVAECFIPNLDNLPTVDHINRDKENNSVENLRWASYSLQNYNKGKYTKPNYPKNNAQSKPVLQYTPEGELVREWASTRECHRNGFNQGSVAACCRGKLKSHKGYIFKYKNEELEQV